MAREESRGIEAAPLQRYRWWETKWNNGLRVTMPAGNQEFASSGPAVREEEMYFKLPAISL